MSSARLEERDFRIEDEGDPLRTLRGRLTYAEGAAERGERLPCALVLHGFKGFMDWGFHPEIARRLARRGLAVVRFNFSGSGVGEDGRSFTEERAFFENTPTREIEDVDRVRAWLDSGAVPWIDPRRAALLGHSMGGGVALIHAARRQDYRALACWASVATFRRFPPEVEGQWRRDGFVEIPNLRTREVHRLGRGWLDDLDRHADALDVVAACGRLAAPTLFLHGSEDEAVSPEESRRLLRAFGPGSARLEVVPGANHTFGAVHPLAAIPPALERVLAATAAFLVQHTA
jgi:dienelactone hydrolase